MNQESFESSATGDWNDAKWKGVNEWIRESWKYEYDVNGRPLQRLQEEKAGHRTAEELRLEKRRAEEEAVADETRSREHERAKRELADERVGM